MLNKKLIAVLLILSCVFLADNMVKYYQTPSNSYYAAYDSDEIGFLSVEKSYIWGFTSPWLASNDTVFHNLVEGSNFVIAPFGIFYLLFKADLRMVFLATKFVLSILYFALAYKLIEYFIRDKKQTEMSFLIFALAVGIGGIAYLAVTHVPFLGSFVSPENYIYMVGGGSLFTVSLGQLYLVISLIFGYASLLAQLKHRYNYSTIFLAASIISYPTIGGVFLFISVLHMIVYRKLVKRIFTSIALYVPWIIVFIQKPIYLKEYAQGGLTYTNIYAFFVYGGFALIFSLYAYYKFMRSYLKGRKIKPDTLFIMVIGALTMTLSIIPTPLTPVAPRYIHLTVLPLAILSIYGILEFSKKYKIDSRKIVYFVVIMSIPTIFVFYFFVLHPAGVYIEKDEYNALAFLKSQPQGNVVSTRWPTGALIPYYAEKRSMLGRMTGTLEKHLIDDTDEFFTTNNESLQMYIIKKYNLTYLFYGADEANLSKFDPAKKSFLEKIYDNNSTKIYKVVQTS